MLEPTDRRHLLDALRPPDGYTLDCAVGTTFSLDLLALLTVPLAFTLFDWQDDAGRPAADPLAILESLRRHADRIHIFCQAGRIAVPQSSQPLYGYLEESVFQVAAPNEGGVFHPKIWALRFTAPEPPVQYRLLCLSRNLTFDRSWDTALVLDGKLVERQKGFGANNPLGDFIAALPELALQPIPEQALADVDRVQDEVRRVQFDLPAGFDDVRFWPLGLKGYKRWPFGDRVDRLLVISPFLSKGCLDRLTEQGNDHILVSRLESLQALSKKDLADFKRVYFLNPAAEFDEAEAQDSTPDTDSQTAINGLHAKLYVADHGWKAHVWTGSANATEAAFKANVEFLVELVGKKSACGVDALLAQSNGTTALANLLQEYAPKPALKPDPIQQHLDQQLTKAQNALARARLVAKVIARGEANLYGLQLRANKGESVALDPGVEVQCWPITLQPGLSVTVKSGSGLVAEFERLSFEALTAFFAFELTATKDGQKLSRQFVVNIPLEGAPADRRDRILRSLLQNRDQVIRFLLFILAEGRPDSHEFLQEMREAMSGGVKNRASGKTVALFESMVKALAHDPAKLDQIARLVDDLRKTPEGQQLLPEGFDSVWKPIWSARQRLSQ